MDNDEYAVYDTVWDRYVGGVSTDQAEQQTIADALTASTGREHSVVQVEAAPPGATETAYFVATGPVYATDGGGGAGTLVFEADDRQGDLPAWASIDDGDIALSDDAGTCAGALRGLFDFDFSGTTPQDSGGNLSTGLTLKVDGTQVGSIDGVFTPGDDQDEQSSAEFITGGLVIGSTVTVEAYPGADDVTDGTATPRVAVTITRLAPAPELPE